MEVPPREQMHKKKKNIIPRMLTVHKSSADSMIWIIMTCTPQLAMPNSRFEGFELLVLPSLKS